VLAAIPSPSSKSLEIAGLELRYYGMAIALGVFAAIWLADRRHLARGGRVDDFGYIGVRAAIAGLVGSRVYHVITDWRSFEGRWGDAVKIWEGGLGIPGGLLAGTIVGLWAAHRRGLPTGYALDIAAPALPLAQAIGRLGNWFNQELFGKPSTLPWAVKIDERYRPLEYASSATFHPTFLYEAVWNLALMAVLLWLDAQRKVARGKLFAVYVLGYGIGRLWVEALRIDKASEILGLRVNIWVSLVAIVGGALWLAFGRERPEEPVFATAGTGEGTGDGDPTGPTADDTAAGHASGDDTAADDTADLAAADVTDGEQVDEDEPADRPVDPPV
jgi:prolipoprotein diacylglyceryl transferase